MKRDGDMYVFRMESEKGDGMFLGVDSQLEVLDWVEKLRDCGKNTPKSTAASDTSTLSRARPVCPKVTHFGISPFG